MQVSPAIHQVLYISRLAPGHEYDAFVSVCRSVRLRHETSGCKGALLFDGDRFCHLLQGPSAAVRALLDELAADPRHAPPTILADDAINAVALRCALAAGYCDVDDLDVFEPPARLQGEAAVTAFSSVLSRAELSP